MLSLLLRAAECIEHREHIEAEERCETPAARSTLLPQRPLKADENTRRQRIKVQSAGSIGVGDILCISPDAWSDSRRGCKPQLVCVVHLARFTFHYVVLSAVPCAMRHQVIRELRKFVKLYRGKSLRKWSDVMRLVQWLPLKSPHILGSVGSFL
jgi:hypothetical protein